MKSLFTNWNLQLAKSGCAIAAAALLAPSTFAGSTSGKLIEPVAPADQEPFVTGTLSFVVDTHFISYGLDVWGAGNDWNDPLFHPSLELSFNLGNGVSAIIGTWWDVNDNDVSSIGGKVQEIDVWAGLSYTTGDFTFTLLYQEWMYASESERIVDFKIAYDHALAPYLLVHSRVDNGLGLETGVIGVVGIAPSIEAGPVTIGFPVSAAFATDEYHGGDAGFAYASVGVTASIPIVEHVSLTLGVTGYYTDDSVIPSNPDDTFITGSAGLVISF